MALVALAAGADTGDTNVVTSTTKLKNVPTTATVSEIVNVGAGSPTNRLLWTSVTNLVAGKTGTDDFAAATNDLWKSVGCAGQARPLPKYLHFIEVADPYPEEAKWYYEQAYGPSACSSVRDGRFHSRNYDWNFDSSCVFVVSTLPGPGRFASVGVGGVGTNLTEDVVVSGRWSKWYKAVPGHMLDGINEKGVCVNVNVISSHSHTNGWHGDPAGDGIHCLAAVRWVLDNAASAEAAAAELARRVYVPQAALGKGYSFHYMISDATSTWIAEDGRCSNFTGRAAMTNVRSLDADDPCGTGRERLALLNAGGSITDAWYTKAYTDEADKRLSEFVVTGTETDAELAAAWQAAHDYWVSKPREGHRGEVLGDQNWWQTVHTAVYDLSAKTMKVAVQETDDWYVFQVPASLGSVLPTDPVFSNAVAAAVRSLVTTNNAAFCAAVRDVGGFPVPPADDESGNGLMEYGTLGVAVAAAAASVAALKRNKADKSVYDEANESMRVDTFVGAATGDFDER